MNTRVEVETKYHPRHMGDNGGYEAHWTMIPRLDGNGHITHTRYTIEEMHEFVQDWMDLDDTTIDFILKYRLHR